jgi:hypothetical protein
MGSRGRKIEVGGSLRVLVTLYRVFQEERSLFCEVILSVIVRQKCTYKHVSNSWVATDIELFESTIMNCYKQRYITVNFIFILN